MPARSSGGAAPSASPTCLDDLLDDPGIRAVAIATPAATHTEIALGRIDAGEHVLIEKPLATSFAERRSSSTPRTTDLILMTDHTYCYTAAVQHIRDEIAEGTLGQFQYIDSVRINLGLVQPDIDVFWDLAPHDLSILDFVLPGGCTPIAVSARVPTRSVPASRASAT